MMLTMCTSRAIHINLLQTSFVQANGGKFGSFFLHATFYFYFPGLSFFIFLHHALFSIVLCKTEKMHEERIFVRNMIKLTRCTKMLQNHIERYSFILLIIAKCEQIINLVKLVIACLKYFEKL